MHVQIAMTIGRNISLYHVMENTMLTNTMLTNSINTVHILNEKKRRKKKKSVNNSVASLGKIAFGAKCEILKQLYNLTDYELTLHVSPQP